MSFYCFNVVRCCLIYEIVQPVGKKQIGVRPPGNYRLLARIVIREIVFRNVNFKSLLLIAKVFVFQRILVILRMSRDKDLLALACGNGINSRLL